MKTSTTELVNRWLENICSATKEKQSNSELKRKLNTNKSSSLAKKAIVGETQNRIYKLGRTNGVRDDGSEGLWVCVECINLVYETLKVSALAIRSILSLKLSIFKNSLSCNITSK